MLWPGEIFPLSTKCLRNSARSIFTWIHFASGNVTEHKWAPVTQERASNLHACNKEHIYIEMKRVCVFGLIGVFRYKKTTEHEKSPAMHALIMN